MLLSDGCVTIVTATQGVVTIALPVIILDIYVAMRCAVTV